MPQVYLGFCVYTNHSPFSSLINPIGLDKKYIMSFFESLGVKIMIRKWNALIWLNELVLFGSRYFKAFRQDYCCLWVSFFHLQVRLTSQTFLRNRQSYICLFQKFKLKITSIFVVKSGGKAEIWSVVSDSADIYHIKEFYKILPNYKKDPILKSGPLRMLNIPNSFLEFFGHHGPEGLVSVGGPSNPFKLTPRVSEFQQFQRVLINS